nr:MAG TPA: Alginate and motility regulator [Caudoviricetes sp.]
MNHKMGRPKLENPKTIRFSVCLDSKLMSELNAYCEKHKITKGEAVRNGIVKLLEQK